MLQQQMRLLRNEEAFTIPLVLNLGDFRWNWYHL